jgi:anti-anti-sigma regulatory factor
MTCQLTVFAASVGSYVYMRVQGTLDSTTYRQLRDHVIKVVLEQPRAVIVDVSDIVAPEVSAWAVFTSARWHVRQAADVPIALVCADQPTRVLLSRLRVSRYVPAYESFRAAVAAIADGSFRYHRRAHIELPPEDASITRAGMFAVSELESWCMPEPAPVASEVATLLVGDALAQTPFELALKLESDGLTVTVAVEDKNTGGPKKVAAHRPGLTAVSMLCRSFGCAPTPAGQRVWAVIGPENLARSG